MDLPRQLAGEDSVRFDPGPQGSQGEVQGLRPIRRRELGDELGHRARIPSSGRSPVFRLTEPSGILLPRDRTAPRPRPSTRPTRRVHARRQLERPARGRRPAARREGLIDGTRSPRRRLLGRPDPWGTTAAGSRPRPASRGAIGSSQRFVFVLARVRALPYTRLDEDPFPKMANPL